MADTQMPSSNQTPQTLVVQIPELSHDTEAPPTSGSIQHPQPSQSNPPLEVGDDIVANVNGELVWGVIREQKAEERSVEIQKFCPSSDNPYRPRAFSGETVVVKLARVMFTIMHESFRCGLFVGYGAPSLPSHFRRLTTKELELIVGQTIRSNTSEMVGTIAEFERVPRGYSGYSDLMVKLFVPSTSTIEKLKFSIIKRFAIIIFYFIVLVRSITSISVFPAGLYKWSWTRKDTILHKRSWPNNGTLNKPS